MWILHKNDTNIPLWLKSKLNEVCLYCGSDMENYYNELDKRCTDRRCSSPVCPAMIASRADFIREILCVKGLGFAKLYDIVRQNNITDPVDIIPYLGQFTIPLYTYLRLHCFVGIDSEWETICKKADVWTLDDLYARYYGDRRSILDDNRERLYAHESYVKFYIPETEYAGEKHIITLMITGTPYGFESKEHFINCLNQTFGKFGAVFIHQKTKRQSGVNFLIRDNLQVTTGKVETALKAGIPICTSEDFVKACAEIYGIPEGV